MFLLDPDGDDDDEAGIRILVHQRNRNDEHLLFLLFVLCHSRRPQDSELHRLRTAVQDVVFLAASTRFLACYVGRYFGLDGSYDGIERRVESEKK